MSTHLHWVAIYFLTLDYSVLPGVHLHCLALVHLLQHFPDAVLRVFLVCIVYMYNNIYIYIYKYIYICIHTYM